MVSINIEGAVLVLEVKGFDKLWSLRSRLEIPLGHVTGIRPEPGIARGWFDRIKLAGSFIPGLLTAGTFFEHGALVFWDVHNPENAVAIDLDHERYERLIVEVEDPIATVRLVESHRSA